MDKNYTPGCSNDMQQTVEINAKHVPKKRIQGLIKLANFLKKENTENIQTKPDLELENDCNINVNDFSTIIKQNEMGQFEKADHSKESETDIILEKYKTEMKKAFKEVFSFKSTEIDFTETENNIRERVLNEIQSKKDSEEYKTIKYEFKNIFNSLRDLNIFLSKRLNQNMKINQDGFFKYSQIKFAIKDQELLNIIDEKCSQLLFNLKIKEYKNKMRRFMIINVNWEHNINLRDKHDHLSKQLIEEFKDEMTKSRIFIHNQDEELAKLLNTTGLQFFEKRFEKIIDYRKEWTEYFKDNVFYIDQNKLKSIDSNLREKLHSNSDLVLNILKRIFGELLNKNNENFKIDLDIIVEVLQHKFQTEFESYLKNDLFSEFKTKKLYEVLIEMTLKKMSYFVCFDPLENEMFVEYQNKLKDILEDQLDHLIFRQKQLIEKTKNIRKKCYKDSIELYIHLRNEFISNNSELEATQFSKNEQDIIDKILEHLSTILSALIDDFSEEYYQKLFNEMKEKILYEIEIKRNVILEESEEKSKNDDLECVKQNLLSIYFHLENSLKTNDNISGIKRRAIEEELKNAKVILDSNEKDYKKYENQKLYLDELCKILS